MTLRKYKNPSHRLSNGKCCDHWIGNFGPCYPCDAYFKLCVSQSVSGSSAYSCNIGRHKTGVVGDRDDHTPNIRRTFPFRTFQVSALILSLSKLVSMIIERFYLNVTECNSIQLQFNSNFDFPCLCPANGLEIS